MLAAALVAVCAQQTQFVPRFTMPTGPIVVFDGPSPGLRLFQNSSSPAFASMQFGKLSELDALGNSIPVHTITTLAALTPEVTSGKYMPTNSVSVKQRAGISSMPVTSAFVAAASTHQTESASYGPSFFCSLLPRIECFLQAPRWPVSPATAML
jgi:hypothetical protein